MSVALIAYSKAGYLCNGDSLVCSEHEDYNNKVLGFATLGTGSSWYVYGATITNIISKADSDLIFDVLPNSGGVGNLLLLQNKEVDIGLGFNNVNSWGYQGILAFKDHGKIETLRSSVAGLDQMYVGIAKRNSAPFNNLRQIAEQQIPIRLMTANKGSASEFSNRVFWDSISIKYEDIIEWGGTVDHTDFGSIIQAFNDGKCDLFMHNISVGHASFTRLCVSADVEMLLLYNESLEYMQTRG